jgi:hypothetical protein
VSQGPKLLRSISVAGGTVAFLILGAQSRGSSCCQTGGETTSLASVSTLAGSGLSGAADGNASDATFVVPAGVAIDSSGTILIADRAAQRIRAISRDGVVTTVAGTGTFDTAKGYAPPGDVDGPVSAASFAQPAGIAVGADGSILVADFGNMAVRVIKFGMVSTLVGNAQGLREPLALSVTKTGRIFVADRVYGVAEIKGGALHSLGVGVDRPTGIAARDTKAGLIIAIADFNGITVKMQDGKVLRWTSPGDVGGTQGHTLGAPYNLAFLTDTTVVYSDLKHQAIGVFDVAKRFSRPVIAPTEEDQEYEGAGFRDGPAEGARVNTPMGIAAEDDGTIVFADAANRRIRAIRGLDVSQPFFPEDGFPIEAADPHGVIVVGDSLVWWNSFAADSIGYLLQQELNVNVPSEKSRSKVISEVLRGSSFSAVESEAAELLDARLTPRIVVFVSGQNFLDQGQQEERLLANPALWESDYRRALSNLRDSAVSAGARVWVCVVPTALSDSLSDSYGKTRDGAPFYPVRAFDSALVRFSRAAGLSTIDLAPVFQDYLARREHQAIFSSTDTHLTKTGRALVADAIAKAIMQQAK